MMEKKIKVLHIGEYVHGGVATYLKTLIQGSEKYGIETYLLMSKYKSETSWDIQAERLFFYPYERSFFNAFSAMKCIYQYIEQIQPDVIHVHSSWAGLFVRVPYLFKRKNIKIIYTSHGWAFLMNVSPVKKKIYASIERILSLVTDKIINISHYEQDNAIQFGVNQKKMMMIYNGVEDVKIKNVKNDIGIDKTKINLLFVGRIDHTKGLDIFLKVYDQGDFPNLHLYVIGEGVLEYFQLENTKKTTYLGWVKNEEIDQYYRECDAVIMPSRWEGFGLVAVEAMRNSKPVIASNRGALPELITHEQNGYIFDLKNVKELKNILINLEKSKLNKMGMISRKIYLEKFRGCFFREKTYQLYKSFRK